MAINDHIDDHDADPDMRYIRLSSTLYRIPTPVYDAIVDLLDERAMMIASQISLQEVNAELRQRLQRNTNDTN
jgi:hypothetical protein